MPGSAAVSARNGGHGYWRWLSLLDFMTWPLHDHPALPTMAAIVLATG